MPLNDNDEDQLNPQPGYQLPGPMNADGSMASLLPPPPVAQPAPPPLNPAVAAYLKQKMAQSAPPALAPDTSGEDDDSPAPSRAPAASPVQVPQAPGGMNPVVAKYLQDQADMRAAQEQSRQGRFQATIARAGGMLGHALSRSNAPLDEAGYKALDANAEAPVNDLVQRQAAGAKSLQTQQAMMQTKNMAEADDPNSPAAAQLRAIYKPILSKVPGMDPSSLDGLSPSQIKDFVTNPAEFALKQQTLTQNKQLALQAAHDRSSDVRDSKQVQAYNQTVLQLEQMRGSPAAAQAEKDIYAAAKANSLIKTAAPDGDLNKMSDAQAKLLTAEISKIASGGQATQSELNALDPGTLTGRLAKVWGQLSNAPTAANAGAFLKQYKDYADSLTRDAQQVIGDRYGRMINSRSDQFSDAQNQNLQNNYVNRFKAAAEAAAPSAAKTYSQDVSRYAQTHGITPAQAQSIKDARTGGQ